MSKPTIDRDEARRVAALAQLALDDDELERIAGDLARILDYVGQLQEVDVEGVEPTAHVVLERLALRPDDASPSLPRDRILAQAPHAADDGFAVPAFVDEG
jgi:aspartyl-tRNA(Asn)/glutamyl-tRNA(Gln) amidotransferase subunit C